MDGSINNDRFDMSNCVSGQNECGGGRVPGVVGAMG